MLDRLPEKELPQWLADVDVGNQELPEWLADADVWNQSSPFPLMDVLNDSLYYPSFSGRRQTLHLALVDCVMNLVSKT